ncbi:MAG: hypothetical protein PHU14_04650 [Methylovulum sp.]|nr:hypothetical protein [Methylovulum sp.]
MFFDKTDKQIRAATATIAATVAVVAAAKAAAAADTAVAAVVAFAATKTAEAAEAAEAAAQANDVVAAAEALVKTTEAAAKANPGDPAAQDAAQEAVAAADKAKEDATAKAAVAKVAAAVAKAAATKIDGPSSAQMPPNDSWLGKYIAPMIALLTVILTFVMFGYFIHVANGPVQETRVLYHAESEYKQENSKLDIMPEGPEKVQQTKKVKTLLEDVVNARADLEESKERRGMLKDFIIFILGVLSSTLTTIFSYYFGSSKGSTRKDEMLNDLAKGAGNTGT